jgi:hypothetical protein
MPPRARRYGANAADLAVRLNFGGPGRAPVGRPIGFIPTTPVRSSPRRPSMMPLSPLGAASPFTPRSTPRSTPRLTPAQRRRLAQALREVTSGRVAKR